MEKQNQNTKADIVDRIISFETGDLTLDEIVELFQELIDTGLAWTLQGSYGRIANNLIVRGYCHHGKE